MLSSLLVSVCFNFLLFCIRFIAGLVVASATAELEALDSIPGLGKVLLGLSISTASSRSAWNLTLR